MLTINYDILGIHDGDVVLDAGCGEGRHSIKAYQSAHCTVCALDIEQKNAVMTKYLLTLLDEENGNHGKWLSLRGNAVSMPFPNDCFDKVICSEVLEHIPDDRQVIHEFRRILKSDGVLAVSVPSYFSETIYWTLSRQYYNQPGGHIRKYRLKQLISILRDSGFDVFNIHHEHALHVPYWFLRCLFGINREKAFIPSLYHRFLVWDIETGAKPVRFLEKALNPAFGKSVVLYARKNMTTGGQ
ncbi:MAG TPA: class I SAM-dependent methyltransferase [Dehalococcoidales bacterium]